LHIERKLLTLVEIAHASTLDLRNVHEHIGAAVVLNDKAVTLLGIEEFNRTCGHQWPPYLKTRKGVVTHPNHFAWVLIRDFACLGEGRLDRNCKVRRNRERCVYSDTVHALQSALGELPNWVGMSALGQKQTYAVQKPMSAVPPIATAKADSRKRS